MMAFTDRFADRVFGAAARRSYTTRCASALVCLLAGTATAIASCSGAGTYIRDTEIERLLADYSRPIFLAAGLGDGRVRMRIVKASGFNAFVLDGRNVFINTGTLMISETPGEVIGVIAHEAGHIAGGHLAGLRTKIRQDQTRLLLMRILGIGALAAGAAAGNDTTRQAAGTLGRVLSSSDPIIRNSILSYRRVQESAADQAGISYLTASKQSARGMIISFERLAENELFLSRGANSYARSHPLARTRIVQMRRAAQQSPYWSKPTSRRLQMRHDLMRAKLSGYLENRATVLNRFGRNNQTLPARYARAIAHGCAGDMRSFLPEINALIERSPRNPYFQEVKADMLFRENRLREAIAPQEAAIRLSGGSLPMKVRLAQALWSRKSSKDVRRIIKMLEPLKPILRRDRIISGYGVLAKAYDAVGRRGDAELMTAIASMLVGNRRRAQTFARRAKAKFKRSDPRWVQADDIVSFKK